MTLVSVVIVLSVVAVAAIVAAIAAYVLPWRSASWAAAVPQVPERVRGAAPRRGLAKEGQQPVILGPADVLVAPTTVDNEFLVVGESKLVDAWSDAGPRVPHTLLDAAVGVNGVMKAAQMAGELSGRLVLVDAKTASAVRKGLLMVDGAGQSMGVVRGAGGGIEHLARITPLSSTAASAAVSLPTALAALALQAQLARMEKAIAAVDEQVRDLHWKVDARRAGELAATREQLAQAYRIAQASGSVDEVTWQQLAPAAMKVAEQQDYARQRLQHTCDKIRALRHSNVDNRAKKLNHIFRHEVESVLAELTATNRQLVQFHVLRLWRLVEIGSPTLPAYLDELHATLATQPAPDEVREQLKQAVKSLPKLSWFEEVRNPFALGRLYQSQMRAYEFLDGVDWDSITVDVSAAQRDAAALPMGMEQKVQQGSSASDLNTASDR